MLEVYKQQVYDFCNVPIQTLLRSYNATVGLVSFNYIGMNFAKIIK